MSKFHPKSEINNSKDPESTIILSEAVKLRLEELMMEGDLLEVALEETHDIWSILSHTSNPKSVRKYSTLEENKGVQDVEVKEVKKRGRKRKSDDFELLKLNRQRTDDKVMFKQRKGFNKEKKLSVTGQVKRGPRKVFIVTFEIINLNSLELKLTIFR